MSYCWGGNDRFCERSQALLHADLHTGSIMVTQTSTQCIDPEFGFYGPMGFDVGAFLGNLALSFFSQDGHATFEGEREVDTVLTQLGVLLGPMAQILKGKEKCTCQRVYRIQRTC